MERDELNTKRGLSINGGCKLMLQISLSSSGGSKLGLKVVSSSNDGCKLVLKDSELTRSRYDNNSGYST